MIPTSSILRGLKIQFSDNFDGLKIQSESVLYSEKKIFIETINELCEY